MNTTDVKSYMQPVGREARAASRLVAKADTAAKNQALTLELAHLRRIRFGRNNESLALFASQPQMDLFEETVQADTAAVTAAN